MHKPRLPNTATSLPAPPLICTRDSGFCHVTLFSKPEFRTFLPFTCNTRITGAFPLTACSARRNQRFRLSETLGKVAVRVSGLVSLRCPAPPSLAGARLASPTATVGVCPLHPPPAARANAADEVSHAQSIVSTPLNLLSHTRATRYLRRPRPLCLHCPPFAPAPGLTPLHSPLSPGGAGGGAPARKRTTLPPPTRGCKGAEPPEQRQRV